MQDRIEKSIDLKAPIERVWRAVTDYREFGQWFRVKLDGPFVVGEVSHGWITYPGYEHLEWVAEIQAMETERLFSFTWYPGAGGSDFDYADKPTTLVEFLFAAREDGTHLVIVESGFDKIPKKLATDALRLNEQGWKSQIESIRDHVES